MRWREGCRAPAYTAGLGMNDLLGELAVFFRQGGGFILVPTVGLCAPLPFCMPFTGATQLLPGAYCSWLITE